MEEEILELVNASSGPHVPGHIHCCPPLTTWWYSPGPLPLHSGSWCTGPHGTTAQKTLQSSVTSSLKVLILGVPILSPATSMLRRWLTFTSAWKGLVDCCMGLPGPHSLHIRRSLPCCPSHYSQRTLRMSQGNPYGNAAPSFLAISNVESLKCLP